MSNTRNVSEASLINNCSLHISTLYLIDSILRGYFPEEGIKLANTIPAFRTPFSVMLQNQHLQENLLQEQRVYFILRCIDDFVKLSEKEREDYFNNLEKEYHHDEFLKQFNEAIEKYNLNELLIKAMEDQIKLFISDLDKLISKYNDQIKEINYALAIVKQKLSLIERDIYSITMRMNNLYLKMLASADIKELHVVIFSPESQKLLKKHNIQDLGIQLSKEEIVSYIINNCKDNLERFELLDEVSCKRMIKELVQKKINIVYGHLPPEDRKKISEYESTSTNNLDDILSDLKQAIEKDKRFAQWQDWQGQKFEKDEERNINIAIRDDFIQQKTTIESKLDVALEVKTQVIKINPKIPAGDLLSKLASRINNDLGNNLHLSENNQLSPSMNTNKNILPVPNKLEEKETVEDSPRFRR